MPKTYEASIQIGTNNLILDVTDEELNRINDGEHFEKGYTDYLDGNATFYLFKFNHGNQKKKSLLITAAKAGTFEAETKLKDEQPIFDGPISDVKFLKGTRGSMSTTQKLTLGVIMLVLAGGAIALSTRSVTDDLGLTTPRKIIPKP